MHTQAIPAAKIAGIILKKGQKRHLRTASVADQPGKPLAGSTRRKAGTSPTSSHHYQIRVSGHLNNNYCVNAPIQAQRLIRIEETVNLNQCHQTGPISRDSKIL